MSDSDHRSEMAHCTYFSESFIAHVHPWPDPMMRSLHAQEPLLITYLQDEGLTVMHRCTPRFRLASGGQSRLKCNQVGHGI